MVCRAVEVARAMAAAADAAGVPEVEAAVMELMVGGQQEVGIELSLEEHFVAEDKA